jgi:hypothetical protein
MVKLRSHILLGAALASLTASFGAIVPAHAGEELVGRSVTLAGRKMSCGKADIMIDQARMRAPHGRRQRARR